jgi:large subunit ribosomal protein L32e
LSPEFSKKRFKPRKRTPKFRRQESWKYDKLSEAWRRPKGLDNKMRKETKGVPPTVKVGYGTPKTIRGLHPSGLRPVMVSNVEQVERLPDQDVIVVISARVGRSTKRAITDKARSIGVRVANPFREEVFE